MAILDFLKNKKQKGKAKDKTVKKASAANKPDESPAKAGHSDGPVKMPAKQASVGFSYDAVKRPHISEKATIMAEENQYVFEILPNCSKQEIKKAVEGIYGVNVLSINKIRIPAKKRRLGRTEGFRKSYQKAVVKIKEGQKIEIL